MRGYSPAKSAMFGVEYSMGKLEGCTLTLNVTMIGTAKNTAQEMLPFLKKFSEGLKTDCEENDAD